MQKVYVLFLLVLSNSFCALIGTEEEFIAKISSLMTIGDHKGARKVSLLTKELYPNSKSVFSLYIRSLANDGYLKEALSQLPLIMSDKDINSHFVALESIAWNFLLYEEGISTVSNIASLIGAYKTHDARCVHLLLKKLNSTNAYDRHLAVKMCMGYQDEPLRKKIVEMAQTEKNYFVRLILLQAIGEMRINEGEGILTSVLSSENPNLDEQNIALSSLIKLSKKPTKDQILSLRTSAKTSMKEFCIGLIMNFDMKEYINILIDFLEDRDSSVRAKSLLALITLETDKKILTQNKSKIHELLNTDVVEVSEIAKILLMVIDIDKGGEIFRSTLLGGNREKARFTSRLVGYLGDSVNPLIQEVFEKVDDPIVKANIALAMIKGCGDSYVAAKYLATFLKEYSNKIMMKTEYSPFFIGVDDSNVRHIPYIPNYPNLIDAMTRLQLLSQLAILNIYSIEDTMKHFLKNKMSKVSSAAAIMMLEDSKLEDIDLLRKLLKDKDPGVRLQSALALAFYGRDNSVSPVLEEAYNQVDWEKRIMILEAIGVIGNRSSIPFVLRVMKKESFILQKMSAATLLQCLYH